MMNQKEIERQVVSVIAENDWEDYCAPKSFYAPQTKISTHKSKIGQIFWLIFLTIYYVYYLHSVWYCIRSITKRKTSFSWILWGIVYHDCLWWFYLQLWGNYNGNMKDLGGASLAFVDRMSLMFWLQIKAHSTSSWSHAIHSQKFDIGINP